MSEYDKKVYKGDVKKARKPESDREAESRRLKSFLKLRKTNRATAMRRLRRKAAKQMGFKMSELGGKD